MAGKGAMVGTRRVRSVRGGVEWGNGKSNNGEREGAMMGEGEKEGRSDDGKRKGLGYSAFAHKYIREGAVDILPFEALRPNKYIYIQTRGCAPHLE
jgi:hypothetical protein